jgi:hypothetical protein
MAKCDECGEHENMPYKCRHCGGSYCGNHRLPENHDCPGLNQWNDPQGVFDSGFDDSVENRGGRSQGVLARLGIDTGPGGVVGYFRGNMTYAFLALMWITFGLQYVVFPVLGYPVFSPAWVSVFTLVPANVHFGWTWVTSIFSHAPGLFHIAGNSIVIFFFGRLVEDYIGSRDFALLFIGSGVLAGLGQAAVPYLLGTTLTVPILGASGAALAIMGVLTILNPDLKVYIYFILPVPIWAITGLYAIVSAVGIIGPSFAGGSVANAAHLVGLLIGLAYGYRVRDQIRVPNQFSFGGGGPGGPGGPGGGRGRGPF